MASQKQPVQGVPYNELRQKTVHNAFERDEPILDQLVYHQVRSLELDLHTESSHHDTVPESWYVYHHKAPFFDTSSCTRLSDCLHALRVFHQTFPQHEPVTVFLDMKSFFGVSHTPDGLDQQLTGEIDPRWILQPADLIRACPAASNVRQAITGACRWPTIASLQGKFVFALTGASLCKPQSRLSAYANNSATRAAFLAPEIESSCAWSTYEKRDDIVFLNMNIDHRDVARDIRDHGLLARVYRGGWSGGINDETLWQAVVASGAQFLATDRVNQTSHPWAAIPPPPTSPTDEHVANDGNRIAVRASEFLSAGGDDRFPFSFAVHETQAHSSWKSMVSVPSSHASAEREGCLIARASRTPLAPMFAVCRPANEKPPHVLVRTVSGGELRAFAFPATALGGFSAESPAFVRLDMDEQSDGTYELRGAASLDGSSWIPLHTESFSVPLRWQGVALHALADGPFDVVVAATQRWNGDSYVSALPTAVSTKTVTLLPAAGR